MISLNSTYTSLLEHILNEGYTGYLVHGNSRKVLQKTFPSQYEVVKGDHVTHTLGGRDTPTPVRRAEVIGHVDDGEGIQAAVVRLDGTTRRPDGKTFHITLSHAKDRKPSESNDVIASQGYKKLKKPVRIHLEPKHFD